MTLTLTPGTAYKFLPCVHCGKPVAVKLGAGRGSHRECDLEYKRIDYQRRSAGKVQRRYAKTMASEWARERSVDPADLRHDGKFPPCPNCHESECRALVQRGLPVLCENWTPEDVQRERMMMQ